MKIKFEEDSLQYKLWCEIVNDVYLEFDTTNDASKADDLINKIEKLLNLFISLPVEAQVKPANGVNKFQKFYLGEKVLLTIPMEPALKDVDKKRLSSKGIIKMIWLKLGKTAMYEVGLEREVLGERKMQTDGKILSRLSV